MKMEQVHMEGKAAFEMRYHLLRAHSMMVCQTADGRTVAASARLTAAQVEAAIRRSNFAPNSELDRQILEQIDRK